MKKNVICTYKVQQLTILNQFCILRRERFAINKETKSSFDSKLIYVLIIREEEVRLNPVLCKSQLYIVSDIFRYCKTCICCNTLFKLKVFSSLKAAFNNIGMHVYILIQNELLLNTLFCHKNVFN